MGAGFMAGFKDGVAPEAGKIRLDTIVTNTVNDRKYGADVLVGEDKTYLWQLFDTLTNNQSGVIESPEALSHLLDQVNLAFEDSHYSGRIADRHDSLSAIRSHLRNRLGRN